MTEQAQNKGPCAVCRGDHSEHFDTEGKPITQHAYTTLEGDLSTHAQKEKREKQDQPQRMFINPSMLTSGGRGADPVSLSRLVELLLDKGVLTEAEGLYVAGFGRKPENSGFQDPAQRFGVDSLGGGV